MRDELSKIAAKEPFPIASAAEVAGLGMLAAPYAITKGRLGKILQSTSGSRVAELGGLGLLAGPPAIHLVRYLTRKVRRKRP